MNKETVDKVFKNLKGNDMIKDPLFNIVKDIFHKLGDVHMDKDLVDMEDAFKSHMKNEKSPYPLPDSVVHVGNNIKNLLLACESGSTEDIDSAIVLEMSSIKQDILNYALQYIAHNSDNNVTAKYLLESMTKLRKSVMLNLVKSDNDELFKYILEETNLVDFEDDNFKSKLLSKALKSRKYDTMNYLLNLYKDKV